MNETKKLVLALALAAVFLLAGCALFEPGERGPDGKRRSLGRDIGGAVQMVVEGEYIAGGVAAIAGLVAATGRYFFRRGEKAEKKKTAEIQVAVERVANGKAPAVVAEPHGAESA